MIARMFLRSVPRPPRLRGSGRLLALVLAASAALAGLARADGPIPLADSTVADRWTLANGLTVVTRHVPEALGVAVTVAYPAGTDGDAADRPGLTRLAAEVQMMAAAGDVPERSRGEMESLRPLGWSIKVGRRAVQLAEVATREQFPGVLRQMATRMRGVSVTPAAVKSALATLKRESGAELFGEPDQSLYFQARPYARGATSADLVDLAAMKALEKVTPRDVSQRLGAFVPAHAVLAIAGNLSGINLRALVDHEFAGIPAGSAAPDPPGPAFHPGMNVASRSDINHPIGVVAVEAPALTDSLHPLFFMSLLLIGQHCQQEWPVQPPVRSRFRYSILDEPDLVRFYPPVPADSMNPRTLATQLESSLVDLISMIIEPVMYDALRDNVLWLLGGPMPGRVLRTVRTDGAGLNLLCGSMAARELTGGEAFWADYRRRFVAPTSRQLGQWAIYMTHRQRQSCLLFTPRH